VISRLAQAVPNVFSLARLALGVGFPWVPPAWRAGAVVVAALSDLADGAVSRYFHASGTAGRILDPVADKVFVLSVVVTLLVEGRLKLWEVALVGLRDWAVLLGGCWLLARGRWSAFRRMPPTPLGKATTALQFLFLLALLTFEWSARVVFIPTAVVSGAAAVDYLRPRRSIVGGGGSAS
jgi:phosphatidylglycerophosphate synthase